MRFVTTVQDVQKRRERSRKKDDEGLDELMNGWMV